MMDVVVNTFSRHYLYGTYRDDTHIDYRIIFVPPARSILLSNSKDIYRKTFPVDEAGKVMERTEYTSLRSFFSHLVDGKLSAIEILFAPQTKTRAACCTWKEILKNRDKLIGPNINSHFEATNNYLYLRDHGDDIKQPIQELIQFFRREVETVNSNRRVDRYEYMFERMAEKYPQTCRIDGMRNDLGSHKSLMSRSFRIVDREINFGQNITVALKTLEVLNTRFCTNTDGQTDWLQLAKLYRTSSEFLELLQTDSIQFERPDAELLRAIYEEQLAPLACLELITQNNAAICKHLETHLAPAVDKIWAEQFLCEVYANTVYKKYGVKNDIQSDRVHERHVPECV